MLVCLQFIMMVLQGVVRPPLRPNPLNFMTARLDALTFERNRHPFQASEHLWLCSSCETTKWVLGAERSLANAMGRSLQCTSPGQHSSLSQKPIVVDVGTNCGVYTVAAATRELARTG